MEQGARRVGHHSRRLRVYWRAVERLADLGMAVAALLVVGDFVLIGLGVVMRYVFDHPIVWSDELVALSLTAVVMFSAPKVLLKDEHIGVDIITAKLRGRADVLARIWAAVAVLAVASLLIVNGWKTAMLSKTIRLVTEGQLELPIWMLQLLLPFGGVFLALAAAAQLWSALESWHFTDGDSETG